MKYMLFLLPVAIIFLSSCDVQRAMDRNRIAVQRSTCAINSNVQALEKVTENLQQMQESE